MFLIRCNGYLPTGELNAPIGTSPLRLDLLDHLWSFLPMSQRLVAAVAALGALLTALPAFAVDYFAEDFDGLTLGPVVTYLSEIREREAWTQTPPAGWTVDDSGVPTVGNPNSGVAEFEGWSFVDKDWWITTAGDQDRSQFFSARGIVAVADPDEWDDFGTPGPASIDTNNDGRSNDYNARLLTPSISIGGAATGQLKAFLHSSWRPEVEQKATLTARYNDPANTVVEVLRYESNATSSFFKADAVNEALTLNLSNPVGATSVQLEFRLFDAGNNWWWAFDNLQVFTGASPAADGVLRAVINRDTQAVTIRNQTGEIVDLRGYSLVSNDGVFNEQGASYLSASNSQWLRATQFGDAANDLSEIHLSSADFAAGGTIALGNVWGKYYRDASDVSFQYLVDGSDDPVQGIVEFVGNGGESFDYLDLDFNGAIDIGDWLAFKAGFPVSLTGKTAQQSYLLGDLDSDGKHTALDFIEFGRLYDQANGAGAFALALSVPEPSSVAMLSLTALAFVFSLRSPKQLARLAPVALFALVALVGSNADAQLKLLFEDFEDLPLSAPVEEGSPDDGNVVTRTAPAGWTIDNSGMPGLGNPATDGIVDWAGWSFANKDWWVDVAGNQNRAQFTRGSGTVMIADPDEWEDGATLDGPSDPVNYFDTFIKTPVINIPAGIPAGRIKLSFDSSWRDEAFDDRNLLNNQTATVKAIYNGANTVPIITWDSDPESDFFKNDAENERVTVDLLYDGVSSTVQLEFGLGNAWNDWWWAVDNIQIAVPADPSVLRVNTFNGQGTLVGGDVIPTSIKSIDISSVGGVLTGLASGLSANAGDAADGPDGGSVAGGTPGEQWEKLDSSENRLFEAFLFGESIFTESRSVNLGSLMDPTTSVPARDIAFSYTNSDGDVIDGIVEYFFDNTVGLPGDFNLDGRVDAADYTVWRDGLGTTYTAAQYTIWKNNYGATAMSYAAGAAVPEPGSIITLLVGALATAFARTRRRATVVAATVVAVSASAALTDAATLDRNYRFGDSTFNENATAGAVVGAASVNGATRDSAGLPGMNQIIDLLPKGNLFINPRYVAINDRPDGVTGLGIALNPLGLEEQFLQTGIGEALNFPERSPSSTLAVPAGTIDYRVISDRGFQIWAKPTRISGRANIVMDSNQHGVFIDAAGKYAMRYAGKDYSSNIPAVVGQWANLSVVRPFGPNNGSILYVNGVAAAAATGTYNVERVVNLDNPNVELQNLDTSPLVIGSSTSQSIAAVGKSAFFSGVVDDLEMFVMGMNSSFDFGEYVFENDDRYAAHFKPSNPLDLTGDNLISLADATEFAENWRYEKALTWINAEGAESRLVVGDLTTRAKGDFNFDGRIDLADWGMLNAASPASAAYAMQVIATGIPEPTSAVLVVLGMAGVLARRR